MLPPWGGRRAGHLARGHGRHLLPRDPGLLQKLFRVQGVQGAQVEDNGQKLREDCLVLGVLGHQDVLQHHLKLGLHFPNKLRISQPRTIWKEQNR